jgi:hypothetical protein
MIEKLFNNPHLLHQTADSDSDLPEAPIAGCIDANGTMVLSQEGRHICINNKSVPELCKLLKQLATVPPAKK